MKARQFCSVCKEWLVMEVVPTSDGEDDDGVIWFRCPQCQGFLPKLSGAETPNESQDDSPDPVSDPVPETSNQTEDPPKNSIPASQPDVDESLPWDSPADMMAATGQAPDESATVDLTGGEEVEPAAKPAAAKTPLGEGDPADPIHEYASLLAEKDQSQPTPYRPWETYEVGQCIHHQAWEDCGIVVAKEKLPGNRQVIKCYFEEAGVVRLIEKAPR